MSRILLLILFVFFCNISHSQDVVGIEQEYSSYFTPENVPQLQLLRNVQFLRYRYRGYDNRYGDLSIGKANVIDMADANIYWDILSSTRALSKMNGSRVSYSSTNRNYAHRVQGGLHTELNGFDVKLLANRRWGKNSIVDGVLTDLTSASVSISKSFNAQKLSLVYSGTYGNQGVRSAVTQEVYSLSGNNYYNPNWGMQNGKERNSKVRGYNQNFMQLSYGINVNRDLKITAELSSFISKNSFSLFSWYDASTPYPDYYRYLPDFFGNTTVSDAVRDDWRRNNLNVTQVDWKKMYEANLYSEKGRSHYITKDLVSQRVNFTLNTGVDYIYDKTLSFSGAVKLSSYNSSNYAVLADLLGGDYWVDIDQYLLDDEYYGDKIQNNVRQPNRKVRVGDKFGYNYDMTTSVYDVNAGGYYNRGKLTAHVELSVGGTTHIRNGNYEKEMFPEDKSFGKSRSASFQEYAIRGRASYFLNLRNNISGEFIIANRAPFSTNVFVNIDYQNQIIDHPQNISIRGFELAYNYQSPVFVLGIRTYTTLFNNESYITSYFDDHFREYSDLIMTDIDKIHYGVELNAEVNVTPGLIVSTILAYNISKYNSNPMLDILRNSDSKVILKRAKSYLDGYHLSGTPQRVAVVETRYRLPLWYYITASLNYAGGNYVSVNPIRRMSHITDVSTTPEIKAEMLAQENMGDALTVNLSLSKDFRFANGQRLGVWISIENLLNERNIKYGGYEQMRFHVSSASSGRELIPFKSKYYYAYGTNYYAMISYYF